MDTDQSITRDRIPSGKPITTAVYVLIMESLSMGNVIKRRDISGPAHGFSHVRERLKTWMERRQRRLGRRAGRRNVEKREAVMSCLSGRSRCILVSCHLFTEYFGIL